MNPLAIRVIGKVALAAALAGIVVRGRFKDCRAFPVYLVAVLATELGVALWPARLFRWDFWVFQQALYNVCKVAIALELAVYAFRLFPGARSTARMGWAIVVVVTTLSIVAATPDRTSSTTDVYQAFTFAIQPRIVNGTIWLFVITARLVAFFNLPWSDWHRTISLGFCIYLVVFVTGLNLQRKLGWSILDATNRIDGLAYVMLELWWVHAAWRREPRGDPAPSALRALAARPV